jgi:prepilin-type N-terminal cleavage/methylation domain-containing protein/prepilin-type processing-associated H-X9-DG protein
MRLNNLMSKPGSKTMDKREPRAAFTLIELLAVIMIIAVLAGLLFPVLRNMTERGNATRCLSNMRQLGAATQTYVADHEGAFPQEGMAGGGVDLNKTSAWFNALAEYIGAESVGEAARNARPLRPGQKTVFMCPSMRITDVKDEQGNLQTPRAREPVFAYGFNLWIDHPPGQRERDHSSGETRYGTLLRASQLLKPSKTVLFGEAASVGFDNMAARHLEYRHDGTNNVNMVMVDGHAETFYREQVFVSRGEDKDINRGVIWDPEGNPDQWSDAW